MITLGKKSALLALLSSALWVSACDKDDDKDATEDEAAGGAPTGTGGSGQGDSLVLTGSLALEGSSLALTASSLDDLQLFCVTFEATPLAGTSDFGADGAFSVEMKGGVNFGCFINVKASGLTVGTFVVAGDSDAMGSGDTTSMALSGSVDLGALTLGEDGRVEVPAERIAAAAYEPAEGEGLDLDQMHGYEYEMTCIDAGDAQRLADCKDQLLDNNATSTVFLRVLKGTESGQDVVGLGVWKDEASFVACGSADFQAADMEGSDIEFSQGTIGTFVANDAVCERRSTDSPLNNKNIRNYFAVSKLTKNGAGYSFRSDSETEDHGGGCMVDHATAIEFAGTATEMYGAFSNEEVRRGCDGNPADHVEPKHSAFSVKFVRK